MGLCINIKKHRYQDLVDDDDDDGDDGDDDDELRPQASFQFVDLSPMCECDCKSIRKRGV